MESLKRLMEPSAFLRPFEEFCPVNPCAWRMTSNVELRRTRSVKRTRAPLTQFLIRKDGLVEIVPLGSSLTLHIGNGDKTEADPGNVESDRSDKNTTNGIMRSVIVVTISPARKSTSDVPHPTLLLHETTHGYLTCPVQPNLDRHSSTSNPPTISHQIYSGKFQSEVVCVKA